MAVPGYPLGEGAEPAGYQVTRQWWPGYLIAAALLVVGAVAGAIFQGQLGQFMLAGLQTLPFAILALFAYLGVREMWARVVAYLWLALVLGGLGAFALLLFVSQRLVRAGALEGAADPAAFTSALVSPATGAAVLWVVFGLTVAGLLLLPAVRRAVARLLPIDPRSSVHAIALSVVAGATIISLGQLIAASGAPPLLDMVDAMPEAEAQGGDAEQLLLIVYAFVWTLPGALIAVGFPVVRSARSALERLGFVRPTLRQVLAGIAIALLMVGAASLLDRLIVGLWELMGWPQTDTAAFQRMLGAAVSPIGAVIIGVTAGVGEELAIRGALQPRLGILLSNLFFASLHAFQYGFDGLLSVFIVGLILGLVRARSNTTTSAIVHGVYNFVLVMIMALGLFQ